MGPWGHKESDTTERLSLSPSFKETHLDVQFYFPNEELLKIHSVFCCVYVPQILDPFMLLDFQAAEYCP